MNREKEIFEQALDIESAEERRRHVEGACGSDAVLLARVQALLRADEAGEGFLPERPRETVRIITEKPGDQIGRYKLLQQIGEGGCGVVYMAEQSEPVRRRVALKIIKLGMDTRSVIARFEAERQALALMDHSNIAKVFDAGATDTGRPFFVMELVRGIKITDYCDQNNLSTKERLKLFTGVCQAIQHAHQKGVIHRDIKPSNILVTVNDDVPVSKVIDFGIAKATNQQPLTDKTVFTAFEQFIGTPAYMSPEQAVMTSLDIDTRSDIYSLGVLLYELLTGKTPFDASELLKGGLDEMRRTIRDREPIRPSTRLSTMLDGELTTTAKHRQTEAPKLIHLLRGDLDWIVMKAMEKDRSRRYETASGFAADVQRHLNNEPVFARPPSRLYRFQKLLRRNKLAFGAVGAVLLALVLGLGIATWMFLRERAGSREQARLRQQAEKEATKSAQVARFLKEMLQGVGPSVALGRDTALLREILEKTEKHIGQGLTNQPEVEIELRSTLINTYHEIGLYERAEELARENLQLARSRFGEESVAVAKALGELGNALGGRPVLLGNRSEIGQAEQCTRQALAMIRKLTGDEDLSVADLLAQLAFILYGEEKLDEAEKSAREAIALAAKLSGGQDRVLSARTTLAAVLSRQRKFAEAESIQREVLAEVRKRFGNEHPAVAKALHNLGMRLGEARKFADAEAALMEGLQMEKKLSGNGHPSMLFCLNRLVQVLLIERKYADGQKLLNELLAQPAAGPLQTAGLLRERGNFFALQAKWAEAIPDIKMAIELNPNDHELYHFLAPLLVQTGRLEEYREHCRKAVEHFEHTTDPITAERIAKDCLILPRSDADPGRVANLVETSLRVTTNHFAMSWFQLAKGLVEYRQSRFASAVEWTMKVSDRRSNSPPDCLDVQTFAAQAMARYRLNEVSEARAALAKAWGFAEVKMPRFDSGTAGVGANWLDWIIAKALLEEAKAVIGAQEVRWQQEATQLLREDAKSGNPRALNALAWVLATCVDSEVRDGTTAVALGEKAVAATSRKDAGILDTLAAAYAEVGQFTNAVKIQKEAIALVGDENMIKDLTSRLRLYETNSPYRER